MRYYIIGDEDAVLGFGLVGVEGTAVQGVDQAREVMKTVLEQSDIGIVIITERVADLIRPQVDRFIFTRSFPLIVEIPDRQGPLAGKPGIREMVNQAIGIKL
jgi:V/A-type H+-transporting ATPase subunit F